MTDKNRKEATPQCPHCRSGAETYRYLNKTFILDVDLARQFVQDGREPAEVDDESLRVCLGDTRIYHEHLAHVDVRFPGIIAHLFYPLPDGTTVQGHALIDGNHRAARCRELGRPFLAYILSEDESRRILLKSPVPSAPGVGEARRVRHPAANRASRDESQLSA